MAIRLTELKQKEVVDASTGVRLGEIVDLEIDMQTGQITAFIVPGAGNLWGILKRKEDVVIPWTKIKVIGKDVIIVDKTPGISSF